MSPDTTGGAGAKEAPLAKIRALLTKAERTTNEHEREAYNAKAAELIAKYGVDQAMLAEDDPDMDVLGDWVIDVEAPYAREKADLIGGITEELGCRAVLRTRGNAHQVHLFGYASDLARAELLYTSLLVQAATAVACMEIPWGEHPAAFRRTFLAGFTNTVRIRLRAMEREAKQRHEGERQAAGSPGRSTELVLVGRRDRVSKAMEEQYPKLGSGKRRLSGSGWNAGRDAGRRANLSTSSGLGRATQNAIGGR